MTLYNPRPSEPPHQLQAASERGRHAWQTLGMRVRSITPAMLMRFALVIGALWLIAWILGRAWSILLPFQVGAVLAYLLLPVVNRLDRIMPRPLAILIVFGITLLLIGLGIAYVIPVIVQQVRGAISYVPTPEEVERYFVSFNNFLNTLSPDVQVYVQDIGERMLATARDNVFSYVQAVLTLTVNTLLNVVNTLSFLLGFIIVPFWLFYVLQDEKRGKQAFTNLLPEALREDVVAVARIVDRVFSSYIRGQVILGVIVGSAAFLGLNILSWLGVEGITSTALLGVFAGITEFIPTVGPILGAIPAVILGLTVSWQTALAIAVLYFLIQQVENAVLVPRITGTTLDIHPALLMVVLVSLSQFGLIWAILAAPLMALARDLFRYAYGRLSDPPRPAGELPVVHAPPPKPQRPRNPIRRSSPASRVAAQPASEENVQPSSDA